MGVGGVGGGGEVDVRNTGQGLLIRTVSQPHNFRGQCQIQSTLVAQDSVTCTQR